MMSAFQRKWSAMILKHHRGRCSFCNGEASRIVKISSKDKDVLENLTPSCSKCQVRLSKTSLHPSFVKRLKNKAQEIKEMIEQGDSDE